MKGVVAAGHPLTAQAGVEALRAGGNAVDAAVACVLMSFVAESPLTGPGAGGFMLVHTAEGQDHLLDFFVSAPGHGLGERTPADLTPIDVPSPRTPCSGSTWAPPPAAPTARRSGWPRRSSASAPCRSANSPPGRPRRPREGVEVLPMQGFLFNVLEPIFRSTPECEAIYAPEGRLLGAGDTIRLPELGDLLDRLGAEGPGFLYEGDVAAAVSEWVLERGGLLPVRGPTRYG